MKPILHHPSDELLFDYATGNLGEGWSLAIATHLALCPACRHHVSQIEAVGGSFLNDVAPVSTQDDAFDQILDRINQGTQEIQSSPQQEITLVRPPVIPEPLRSYVGGDVDRLPWRRLGFGASQLLIPLREEGTSARLLSIPAGRPVPEHSHGGLELTLVMSGAFSDETGHYRRGDFQEANDDLKHQPHAAEGADCICLAITDAPLKFQSIAARVAQPFLGI